MQYLHVDSWPPVSRQKQLRWKGSWRTDVQDDCRIQYAFTRSDQRPGQVRCGAWHSGGPDCPDCQQRFCPFYPLHQLQLRVLRCNDQIQHDTAPRSVTPLLSSVLPEVVEPLLAIVATENVQRVVVPQCDSSGRSVSASINLFHDGCGS